MQLNSFASPRTGMRLALTETLLHVSNLTMKHRDVHNNANSFRNGAMCY
jgi:hypothetical protein